MNIKKIKILLWVGYALVTLAVSGGYISVSLDFLISVAYGVGFTSPLLLFCILIHCELNKANVNRAVEEAKETRKIQKQEERIKRREERKEARKNIPFTQTRWFLLIPLFVVSAITIPAFLEITLYIGTLEGASMLPILIICFYIVFLKMFNYKYLNMTWKLYLSRPLVWGVAIAIVFIYILTVLLIFVA